MDKEKDGKSAALTLRRVCVLTALHSYVLYVCLSMCMCNLHRITSLGKVESIVILRCC